MKTRKFIVAVATGMTFGAVVLAADGGMRTDVPAAKQQMPSTQRAPAQQGSQTERIGGLVGPITGADFDRETKSIARSLQRGEISIATTDAVPVQRAGAAGSAGQLMGRSGQLADSGSAWFDGYVDQVNRQLRLSEPASE